MTEPAVSVPRWQRTLLPGGMVDVQSTRRSARDWLVDWTMLLLAVLIGVAVLAETWDDHGDAELVVDLALGLVACTALWWRRSRPVAVALVATLAALISASAGGAGLLALFNAAIRAPRRALAWLSLLALGSALVFPVVYPGQDSYALSVLVGFLLTGVVVGWGLFVRVRRELVQSLHERAQRLEAEQRLRVEQAREAERRRIAREMHDVLAHRVSLLSVHAGALEFRPDASPEEIAEAAGVIRASARAALQELREVIGVLREGEDGAEPPQPTLADVPALVEESRAAGMRVQCRVVVGRDVPDALGRTVYRVVQEGLTNARKHAPNALVTVSVAADDGSLTAEVVSRRAVGVAAAIPEPGLPGAGTGLIGLAERVELAGGSLRHGPGPDGDFVLHAELPVARLIRVLLADDDALVRSGLKMMLSGAAGIEVVGEAEDGRAVLGAVDRHRPDVVLMDIRMPQLDGIAATRLVRSQPQPPAVLVLTTFDADELVVRALRAGAAGFLVKDTPPAELVRAIELVHAGDSMLSPGVTRRLIALVAGDGDAAARRESARERLATLSPREREVALAVGRGAANAEIAAELHMSVATVKAHVSRLLAKLEVENRVQIALLVQDAGAG